MLSRVLSIGLFLVMASAAHASTIGFDFWLTGNRNIPTANLVNTSDSAQITGFSLHVGDTAYNFDAVYGFRSSGPMSVSILQGDTNVYGGTRVDEVVLGFSGFDADERLRFNLDLDRDNRNTYENYRTILINSRNAPNAVAQVDFDTGQTLTVTLPDTNRLLRVGASGAAQVPAVPLPASIPLSLTGLAAFAFFARRKRR